MTAKGTLYNYRGQNIGSVVIKVYDPSFLDTWRILVCKETLLQSEIK